MCMRSNVRNRCGYVLGSSSRSRSTSGVIQPAHSLSRGKLSLSRTNTSTPRATSSRAAADPAGPPPTINTSQVRTVYRSTSVDVVTSPGHIVALSRRKQHLEQLQRASSERSDGAGEIQPPHADELLVKHLRNLVARAVVQVHPMTQRAGIVQPDILDIQDREIPGLENLRQFTEGGRTGARENALFDPGMHRSREIATDGVDQATAYISQTLRDHSTQRRVVLDTDVLEHAHGDECIVF